jgi:hypothetical protein
MEEIELPRRPLSASPCAVNVTFPSNSRRACLVRCAVVAHGGERFQQLLPARLI